MAGFCHVCVPRTAYIANGAMYAPLQVGSQRTNKPVTATATPAAADTIPSFQKARRRVISVIEAIHQPGFEQHLAQVEAVGLALLERHFLLVVAGLGLDFLLLIVVAFDLVAVLPLTFA